MTSSINNSEIYVGEKTTEASKITGGEIANLRPISTNHVLCYVLPLIFEYFSTDF